MIRKGWKGRAYSLSLTGTWLTAAVIAGTGFLLWYGRVDSADFAKIVGTGLFVFLTAVGGSHATNVAHRLPGTRAIEVDGESVPESMGRGQHED